MKKLIIVLLLSFLFLFSGCDGNQVSPNENEIIFHFPTEYLHLLPYEEVPDYHLTFTGIVNTIDAATTTNKKVLGKNDDFIISKLLADLFAYYQDLDRVETRILLTSEVYETRMNILEIDDEGEPYQKSQILKVENGILYEEIAYILLENGLTLTFEYRRFETMIDSVKTMMYCWKYTTPLNVVLHYPLIIVDNSLDEKQFLIVPLPLQSVYHMGLNDKIPLQTFIDKDEFSKPLYRRFYYPDFNDDPRSDLPFDLEANILKVKQYYVTYHQGRQESDLFIFEYLGKQFNVTFYDEDFEIQFLNNID
jgi:hypothetical protein